MTTPDMVEVTERRRLQEARERGVPWKKWGPYLSERQWGTVREDYSDDGTAWDYFSHDQARSRAYHWGEDGLAGISDEKQRLCFALALWNGRDSILKERLFGLTNSEGNHAEDVKEYYFYLDNTPAHSYMKYLYKYPQAAYPYDDLIRSCCRCTPHWSDSSVVPRRRIPSPSSSRRRGRAGGAALVGAWSGAGKTDRTLDWLESSFKARDASLILLRGPWFDPLRPDPRFEAVTRAIGVHAPARAADASVSPTT